MNSSGIGELRAILHAHVRKLKVLERGNALVARHGNLILKAAAESIDAQKPAGGSGNVQVGRGNILDERTPARASLDIDRKRLRASKLAALDADVANAA